MVVTMQTLQDRWLALIEKEMRDHGLDPVSTFSFSNVGDIRGMRGMVPYIQVVFTFQGYASLSIHGRAMATLKKSLERLNGNTATGFPYFSFQRERETPLWDYVSFHALYPEELARVRAFREVLKHVCSRAKTLYIDEELEDEEYRDDDGCPDCEQSVMDPQDHDVGCPRAGEERPFA